ADQGGDALRDVSRCVHRALGLRGADQSVPGRARRGRAGAALSCGARVPGRADDRSAVVDRGARGAGPAAGMVDDRRPARGLAVATRLASLWSVRSMSATQGDDLGFMGHGPLRRHAALLAAQLRISVLAALEYRTGFWSQGVLSLLWSIGGFI